MKRLIYITIPALVCVLLTGCPSGSNQQKAANAAKNIAVFIQQAQGSEIAVFNASQSCLMSAPDKKACIVITPEEHVFIQQHFKDLDAAGRSLDACIRIARTSDAITHCADNALTTVETLNSQGALSLKSDKAQSTFAAVTSTVRLGIQTITTLLGGVA